MARSVDDKVVKVSFDNAGFESKVQSTLTALQKLKSGMDFKGEQAKLQELDAAAKRFDMSQMGTAVEGVSAKFLALSTVAITALATITTKAIESGTQITKALTIQPAMDGFREYETNMNSIQTILANTQSKGSTLDDVNSALTELNHYSDKTIYNFAEMAKNIGTFTAAGVDLDTSTGAIKGIANVAAISGSNSHQASTAMYQLSQAIAQGSVKLMDWNSVVNAGMGGEVFKSALFETGKAMGTLTDVPLDQSFTEWEDAGNSFRNSLQDEWLTGEVLTQTLEAFTGDLSAAQLEQMGYTREQALEMEKLGKLGVSAATEVKTITQLIATVKEAIGTGWADSMKIVLGDFEEAKSLLTAVNNVISGAVGKSADHRNQLLQTWKDFGGRNALISGIVSMFKGLLDILKPIREAFRAIFPRTTAADLLRATDAFRRFAERLQIGGVTATKLRRAFTGFFAIFKLGWEVIKETARFFRVLWDMLKPEGGFGILDFASEWGAGFAEMAAGVINGRRIFMFFWELAARIREPIAQFKQLASVVWNFFSGVLSRLGSSGDSAIEKLSIWERILNGVGIVFGWLGDRAEALANGLLGIGPMFDRVKGYISGFWNEIKGFFEGGGGEGKDGGMVDWSRVLSIAGIAAGAALIIKVIKSITGVFDEAGGLVENISNIFGELGDTLSTFQAKMKADMLMKIAIAIGVLTVSVVALSMIDAGDLAKALAAMAYGFSEMMAVMVLMTKIDPTGRKMAKMVLGMIAMAGAMLILSVAIRSLSGLNMEELATGLAGVAGGLGILVGAVKLLTMGKGGLAGLIGAGIGMMAMAAAMLILSYAMKSMAEMEWEEMGRGLAGVAGGIGALALAMKIMPTSGMIAAGIGVLIISAAMKVLASAVKDFGSMDWDTMKNGMMGMAYTIGGIALAVNLMPPSMPAIAIGILLIAAAMKIMASAIEQIGELNIDQLRQGLLTTGLLLVGIAFAANAMTGAIAGAFAIIVVAGALKILAEVMEQMAQLSLGQIGGALIGIAGVLVVLGLAAAGATFVLPGLIAMAIALPLIGAGFALMGVGAYYAAEAFQTFVDTGKPGIEAFKAVIIGFIDLLPEIGTKIATFVLRLAEGILNGLPPVIDALKVALGSILDALVELVPKLGELIRVILDEIIKIVQEHAPEMIETGFLILDSLLTGLDENIEEITERVLSIIEKFLTVLEENQDGVIEAGVRLLGSFLQGISEKAGEITMHVAMLIVSFINGITAQLPMIQQAATGLIVAFIMGIGANLEGIINAGVQLIVNLINGIAANVWQIVNAGGNLIITFIYAMAAKAGEIVTAGFNALTSFLQGITNNIQLLINKGGDMIKQLLTGIEQKVSEIVNRAAQLVIDFMGGIERNINQIVTKGVDMVLALIRGITQNATRLAIEGANMIIDFINTLANTIRNKSEELRAAGRNLASALVSGMTLGMSDKVQEVANKAADLAHAAKDRIAGIFEAFSPSRWAIRMGGYVGQGLAIGFDKDRGAQSSAADLAARSVNAFEGTIKNLSAKALVLEGMNPKITPVLDLSSVKSEAGKLPGLLAVAPLKPGYSRIEGHYVAHTIDRQNGSDSSSESPTQTGVRDVTFIQNNNSPKALSTNDVYRGTRSQLALAKGEIFK